MSTDQPARRPPAKSSGGGAPMGSTISIVVAVVAVVVGFVILRNINDTGSTKATSLPDPTQTTIGTTGPPGVTTPTTVTPGATPTTVPLVFTPGTVVVANASGIKGAAGFATTALMNAGWTMGTPTDAFGAEKTIATTKVYYLPGGELVAASIAQAFNAPTSGVIVAPMPAPIPVKGASIGDAIVLVMVGTDFANKPLPLLSAGTPEASATTTSTIAG